MYAFHMLHLVYLRDLGFRAFVFQVMYVGSVQ